MSQKQLAVALGMSLRSVAAWEAGATVTPSVIKMLRQLLAGETPEPQKKQGDHVAALITEIAEQRKLTAQRQLTEKAQQHIDRLLTILEKNEPREPRGGRGVENNTI